MRKIAIWAAGMLVVSPLALAQQQGQQPSPALPATVLGTQLVAWSELQKPQPAPQPLPPPQPAPPAQQTQPATGSQATQTPTAQAFTGTIVKQNGKYALKVSESASYQIDEQDKAGQFEGKQVKISGSLDARTNVLHITNIELLS